MCVYVIRSGEDQAGRRRKISIVIGVRLGGPMKEVLSSVCSGSGTP